jgi:hypothetical protein
VIRALDEWSMRREALFGPASGVRSVADGIAIPVLKLLGYTVAKRISTGPTQRASMRLSAAARCSLSPFLDGTSRSTPRGANRCWMPSARTNGGLSLVNGTYLADS